MANVRQTALWQWPTLPYTAFFSLLAAGSVSLIKVDFRFNGVPQRNAYIALCDRHNFVGLRISVCQCNDISPVQRR